MDLVNHLFDFYQFCVGVIESDFLGFLELPLHGANLNIQLQVKVPEGYDYFFLERALVQDV